MKPIDVTSDSFAEYNEDSNNKNLKFKIGDHVRISKYKNILAKGYTPNWSDKIFVINKLKNTVPWTYAISDLNGEELSNVVKNDVIKKTEQNKLVNKVNNIDTSDFVIKTNYNTKITELENKIPDTSNLATKTALTTSENKIPSVSNLVKKTDYNTKITNIENQLNNHNHDEYIDTSKFNTLATKFFKARLAQANLIRKTDFDAKLSSLNKKITKNKTDHLIVKNKQNKLKDFDTSYLIGKSHFEEDGVQNYLIFQPMYKYFQTTNSDYISSWISKGLSSSSSAANNFLTPLLNHWVLK